MEKKNILEANNRAISNIESVIFYLEKNGKKQLEIALLYKMVAELSRENETLATEISDSIL